MKNKKPKKKPGLPPGSLVFTGIKKVAQTNINILRYNPEHLEQLTLKDTSFPLPQEGSITWYDIRGLHEVERIEQFGISFGMHPLVIEDILNIHQRPKFEEYDNGIFTVVRSLQWLPETNKALNEQVAIFTGPNFVLTFQEDEDDLFDPIRERLQQGKGKIRARGADYLTYTLIDALIDNYTLSLNEVAEVLENLEEEVLHNPSNQTKANIYHVKRQVRIIRRWITPIREVVSRFEKADHPVIDRSTELFLRDLYDHTVRLIETVDNQREILSSLQDLYISEISFKMNQIMKVLTIMSSIFIPLSFLAGVYGMNFEYMPELAYKYGYFILLGVMLTVAVSLLLFFRSKKWL